MTAAVEGWLSSTLVFVSDVDRAIAFYVDRLGFTLNMRHAETAAGPALVAGVSRGEGNALLLTSQWPDRVGQGVLYTGGLDPDFQRALFEAFAARGVTLREGFWGAPLRIVEDPDGNQLWFAEA